MAILDDVLAKIEMSLRYNTIVLTHMWQWLQKKEADKTPDDWQGSTTYVPSTQVRQIVGHNPSRASVSIYNASATTAVALSSRDFNANEASTLNTTETTDGTFPFLIVPAGQTAVIGTRGAVYGISLSGANSVELSILETLYSVPQSSYQNPQVALGHSAALEHGYDFDSDLSERLAARIL